MTSRVLQGSQRLVIAVATVLLVLVPFAGSAASAGPPPGTSSGGAAAATIAGSLNPFTSLTLAGSNGAVNAVVYDGNIGLNFASATTSMNGFTVPPAPLVARTTYVVADGQCGTDAPNGCSGRPTTGSGDTLSLTGGAGTLTDGPDAFRGSDGCPWGPDTCLWDTRNFDVSADVAPGDTSVSATVAAGAAGYDCINHEAQVFAVGPAAAWSDAGYVAAGTGLRNQGSGTIAIAGIPSGSAVQRALLYWNVLNPTDPSGAMSFNGTSVSGSLVAQGADPCWDGGSWAYRADVTSLVGGNGTYTLSGYPTGNTGGLNPWDNGSFDPMMEGASLIVFYGVSSLIAVDSDQQTVTGGGAATTINEIPFGDDVETTVPNAAASPVFQLTLGQGEAVKQLTDGSIEVYKSSGAAPAAPTGGYVAVDDTSPVPTVSDSELNDVLTAAPSALLDDSDPDNPPPSPDATNVDPTYDGGDALPAYPDGMTLIQSATDSTGDDVAAAIGVPQVTDANGNAVSSSLTVDSVTNRVTVQVDPNAAFPVHVDTMVGFNEVYDPSLALSASQSTAATSCSNMGRSVIFDPNGATFLEPAFDTYPATCMHYFIGEEALVSANKQKFDLARAGNIRAHSTNPKVQAAGSKFHAVAAFNTGTWGIDSLAGGSAAQQQKQLKKVCTAAIQFRKTMNKPYNGGPDFRVSNDPAVQGDTWVIDEAKHTSPNTGAETSILNSSWGRQKLMQLITCLSNGSKINGYPAAKGFVYMSVRWPDQFSTSYKSGWETLLQNPSESIVTSTFSSHPFWTWIRPRILGWVQEVYPDCLDQCTGPASKTSPGDSLGTMATNINWYLQHPARLAFSRSSNASQETKTTLWQKYIPLENAFYGRAGRDNYDTAFSLVTMDRFARLQIYATRSWATATSNGQYPFRKIGFAWNNNATNQKLLAQELAHSLQGAYSLGATARFACTNTAKSNVSGTPNIGLCKPHLNGATLKTTWNAFGTW